MMKHRLNQTSGFTLIELVITIVIAGIIMVMIGPYFQSGITTSHRPAEWLQDAMAIQRVMENINGAYGKSSKDQAALTTLQNNIGTVNSSFTNKFGAISPYYFTVLENGFITFNASGNETAGGTSVLKVTICSTSNQGNQLTQLFTVQVPH